jgi:hypothetical protein
MYTTFPSTNTTSSRIKDSPNIVYETFGVNPDDDNQQYLYVNYLGVLDNLTLESFLRAVPEPILTSPAYVSDDDMPPVQAADRVMNPQDLSVIVQTTTSLTSARIISCMHGSIRWSATLI